MDYGLPNVSIKHFSKIEPYSGDFSTLFIVFLPNVPFSKPIVLTKKYEFGLIEELQDNGFLKRAIHAFFANGGDRLYLLFFEVTKKKKLNITSFHHFITQSCDSLNDIEVISAINLFSNDIYQNILSMREILSIQRTINNYCAHSHRISISDINSDFKRAYLHSIGKSVIYYPWIMDNNNESLPPSIYASALFSKMAKANKYFESIANKPILNSADVEFRFDDNQLKRFTEDKINPVIFMPHRGVMIWGIKTFDETLDSVNELRVMKYIKRRLIKSTRIYIFEPNSLFLEAQILLMLKVFFENLEKMGAIEKYNVSIDKSSEKAENEIIININLAFSTPIEFINIRLNKADKDGALGII
ncbi:MAG: hypothetical protein Q9M36_03870 [Sulfurovum sp.]|nr:hypothetical protein [Sulfurovum sp.]